MNYFEGRRKKKEFTREKKFRNGCNFVAGLDLKKRNPRYFQPGDGYFQRRWKNRLARRERKRRWAGTVTQKEINTPNERRHTEGLQKGIFDGQMGLCCIEKERDLSARVRKTAVGPEKLQFPSE